MYRVWMQMKRKMDIERMTDGQLINRHGEQLYIAIQEDWANMPYTYLEQLGAELRFRNDAE